MSSDPERDSRHRRCLAEIRKALADYARDPTDDNAVSARIAWQNLRKSNEIGRWRRFRAECFVAGLQMRGATGDPPAMTKIDADPFKQARPKE